MSDQTAHYVEQMRKLAEVGASLCCYLPGAGNPEAWPNSRCDCKFLPPILHGPIADIHLSSEQTGCCEVRTAWRTLDALRRLSQRPMHDALADARWALANEQAAHAQTAHARRRLQEELSKVRGALESSGYEYCEGYDVPIRRLVEERDRLRQQLGGQR